MYYISEEKNGAKWRKHARQMTSQETNDKAALMRQLEQERKELNKKIACGLDSKECLEASRRVDAILEQLMD